MLTTFSLFFHATRHVWYAQNSKQTCMSRGRNGYHQFDESTTFHNATRQKYANELLPDWISLILVWWYICHVSTPSSYGMHCKRDSRLWFKILRMNKACTLVIKVLQWVNGNNGICKDLDIVSRLPRSFKWAIQGKHVDQVIDYCSHNYTAKDWCANLNSI